MGKTPLQSELERVMATLKISARELSRRAGLDQSTVKTILRGKSQHPRHDTLEKLARVTGRSVDELTGHREARAARRADSATPTSGITELNVYAAAGGGAFVETEHALVEWRFPSEWLRSELRARPDKVHILTIEGDSMAPTLMPGDKVVVDLSRQQPSPPGVFIVHDGIALVAKRLTFIEGSDPPRVRISSDNERYPPYERTNEEIRVAGRVVARWQRL